MCCRCSPVPDRRRCSSSCATVPRGAEVLLTRRSMHLRNHKGEISFPGGRLDEGETYEDAALREAFEEVALPPDIGRGRRPPAAAVHRRQPELHRPRGRRAARRPGAAGARPPRSTGSSGSRSPTCSSRAPTARSAGGRHRSIVRSSSSSSTTRPSGGRPRGCCTSCCRVAHRVDGPEPERHLVGRDWPCWVVGTGRRCASAAPSLRRAPWRSRHRALPVGCFPRTQAELTRPTAWRPMLRRPFLM